MSVEAVIDFVNLVETEPALSAEVAAVVVNRTGPAKAAAIAAFAAQRGFDFTEEEYRFILPNALLRARSSVSPQDSPEVDEPPQEQMQHPPGQRVTLLGHSHASVIRLAAEATQFPLRTFYFVVGPQPYVDSEERVSAFHPQIAEAIASGTDLAASNSCASRASAKWSGLASAFVQKIAPYPERTVRFPHCNLRVRSWRQSIVIEDN